MNISSNISNLLSPSKAGYSVSASVNDGVVDSSSSIINGDRNSPLFSSKNQLDKMDFLKLLITQLRFQNPMEPMSNTDFIAQLAQFSALEGTSNIEKAITGLKDIYKESVDIQNYSAMSMTNASAVSLIGKEVRIQERSVRYLGDDVNIYVHLGDENSAILQILDKDGDIVRTLPVEDKDSENSVEIKWDGKDDSGQEVKSGKYTLYIENEENNTAFYCFIEDIVKGVRYTSEGALVKIGGKELPIGNIMDVSMIEPQETGESVFSNTAVFALLGRTVRYKESELLYYPAEGQQVQIDADLGGDKSAIVEVRDADGVIVHTLKIEAEQGNTAHAVLDCIDFNQNGPYTINLADNTSAFFYSEGTVNGITNKNGTAMLKVNGITISMSNIIEVFT